MPGQAIPQPTGSSAAPGEEFTSTEAAPHGPTISEIGVPGPAPPEVSAHTGASNTLDITIQKQFFPIDTFTWNVNQVSGTLLWLFPIHPQFFNKIIAYLLGIYNCWGGGAQLNFKIAGTGFHAGCLAFVRIPPNVNPRDFQDPQSWGAFEWEAVDPKTLEVFTMHARDQRPINYHYARYDPENPSTFGGYIACYVLIPLNTSATGSQTIQVQAFCKPDDDFQFSQLIAPHIRRDLPIFPDRLSQIFQFRDRMHTCANTGDVCLRLNIHPFSEKATFLTTNCFDLLGRNLSIMEVPYMAFDAFGLFKPCRARMEAASAFVTLGAYAIGDHATTWLPTWQHFVVQPPTKFKSNGSRVLMQGPFTTPLTTGRMYNVTSQNVITPTWVDYEVDGIKTKVPQTTATMTSTTTAGENNFAYLIYDPSHVDSILEDKRLSAIGANESIVTFSYGVGNGCIQTSELARNLYLGYFKDVAPEGSALLYTIFDIANMVPIGYIKLNSTGLFTASARDSLLVFALDKIEFRFHSFIRDTDPIPGASPLYANALLVAKDHKKYLSRASKWLPSLLDSPDKLLETLQICLPESQVQQ